ncbi:FBP domain-containing protein [Actinoplanes sp. NPDC051411]|uniref:FBP domain-containing protein n=1 Tax=Actinoplanes sp. NPDC051411 TaxID=3155522 RepID=UPI0034223AA7
MEPISEAEIRRSFLNCSKGDATRVKLPPDFAGTPWADLDFFGWIDPSAPLRAAMAVPGPDGLRTLMLRRADRGSASGGAARSSMCQVCLTSHGSGGVSLFTAARAGASGRKGNSLGEYLCSDLACSLYLRGKRQPRLRLVKYEETLSVEEKIERAMTKLDGFVRRVAA